MSRQIKTGTRAKIEPLEERRMMSAAAHVAPLIDNSAYEFELGKPGVTFQSMPAPLFGAAPVAPTRQHMLEPGFEADVIESEIATQTYAPRIRFWGHDRSNTPSDAAAKGSPFSNVAIDDSIDHPPQARLTTPPPPVRHHLLLVEDDPGTRMALTKILQSRGWDVTAVGTLREGIDELNDVPEVCILDLTLPDGEGETLLRQIRGQHLPTTVAVTTGNDDASRLQHVEEMGADAILSKPINIASLLQQLPHLPQSPQGALAA